VAQELGAVYVRIDTIEQTLRNVSSLDVQTEGYVVAYKIASDNLVLGSTVVADSVNPVSETRHAWRTVAEAAGAKLIEIEIVCSDREAHRYRLETRVSDIEGLVPPNWKSVLAHDYEQWDDGQIVIDTADESPAQSPVNSKSSEIKTAFSPIFLLF